jgi:hypothetical protein
MARGTITPVAIPLNAGTAGSPIAIDSTNNHQLITSDGMIHKIVLQFVNTGTVTGTISVEPGVYPPAMLAAFPGTAAGTAGGTLIQTVAAGGTAYMLVEGGKFVQADGKTVYIDYSTGWTGQAVALEVPFYQR